MLTLLFVAFLLLLVIGFDVGFSMILSSWLGVLAKTERAVDATVIPLTMISYVDSYALVQIPLFILAGELMNRGGLTQRLLAFECDPEACDGEWHTCWNCGGEGAVDSDDWQFGDEEICPVCRGEGSWRCPNPLE